MAPLQRGGNWLEIRPRLQGLTAGHGQEWDLNSGPLDAGSAPRRAGGAWRPSGPLRPGALACQHCPRVSAFPARLVRPPCDSCPAWRRLVTRTHRLMRVSPRKQKATVTGGGGAAGALWVAERVDPAGCPAPCLRQEGLGGGREALQLTCLRTQGRLRGAPPMPGSSAGPGVTTSGGGVGQAGVA